MQHLEDQEQQQILSQLAKRDRKIKKYKQYLVQSGCVMHFVKFLLGVRNKQKFDDSVPNEDVLQMFKQYIGAIEVDTAPLDLIKNQIQSVKDDSQKVKLQIIAIKQQIKLKKQEKIRKAEQARIKEQQQAAKNAKKGPKK